MTSNCSNNTLDFCRNALNAYGKQGDQTLEYIGLNLRANEISEQRIYRKRTPLLMEQIKKEMPYGYILRELMGPFCQKETVKLCDISQSFSLGEQTFRAVFSLPKKQHKDETERDIHDFFACLPNSTDYRERLERNLLRYGEFSGVISPLLQIGVEVNRNCQLRGIKYYIRIQDFAFLKGLDAGWQGLPEQRCNRLDKGGYKPIFIGINDYSGIPEEKLYFISKSVGFKKPEILANQKKLAKIFGWEISEEIFDGLYKMDLYTEGIAFCAKECTWRLYFREFMNRG